MDKKEKLGQEPAFVNSESYAYKHRLGMSKRFYAACAAMQGFMAAGVINPFSLRAPDYKAVIKDCYDLADELLKQEDL